MALWVWILIGLAVIGLAVVILGIWFYPRDGSF